MHSALCFGTLTIKLLKRGTNYFNPLTHTQFETRALDCACYLNIVPSFEQTAFNASDSYTQYKQGSYKQITKYRQ